MSVDLPKLVLTPVGAAIADRLPADHKERWRRLVDTSERLALREGQSRDQTRWNTLSPPLRLPRSNHRAIIGEVGK